MGPLSEPLALPVSHRSLTQISVGELPSPAAETTILVVAQHALVRAGLRAILSENPGLSVIPDAPDAKTALRAAVETQPDVVLFDEPPSSEESRILSRMRRALPSCCFLCLGESPGRRDLLCVPSDAGVV